MRRHILLAALLSTLALPLHGFWDCIDAWYCGSSRLYLGPQVYYTKLDIESTDSTIAGVLGLDDTNTHPCGVMYGANGGYEYKQAWGLYANVDLNYGQGKLKRSGAETRYVHEYEATGILGFTFGGCEDDALSFTPYTGLGYLTQCFNLTGLHEKYRNSIVYVPIGFKCDYAFCWLCSYWTVGLNAAVMPQVDSQVKFNILRGAYWTLAKRSDWIVSLPIEYYSDLCPLSLRLDLFWKKVGIGGSKAATASGETLGLPPSKWNAVGASLDLVWEF